MVAVVVSYYKHSKIKKDQSAKFEENVTLIDPMFT